MVKDGPNEKFWSKLVDLAYDITDVLKNLSGNTIIQNDAAIARCISGRNYFRSD